ncbi:ubiquitin carboxyl-terminal hydrolase 47-like isoform X2 [Ctenocephalides felis]|uniref:ubiquitin carboxyl-terminal hydrolase 47-like isoform X2 n=1 Tax=Ctenocephalides felis TaxID=7515 RepID=UPI000E6E3A9A|nr:ubiquitin carboxyl-terminal hydrolase 47-like isoform X2 [Ctenocephalides felis]
MVHLDTSCMNPSSGGTGNGATLDGAAGSGQMVLSDHQSSTDEGSIVCIVHDNVPLNAGKPVKEPVYVRPSYPVMDLYLEIAMKFGYTNGQFELHLKSANDAAPIVLNEFFQKTCYEAGLSFTPGSRNHIYINHLRNRNRRKAIGEDDEFALGASASPLNDYPPAQNSPREQVYFVGLVNQAMTCYLNSLLQALYMTPEFRNALYNWKHVDSSSRASAAAKSIPLQLQRLFLQLQTSERPAVETTDLTRSFGWDSTEAWQQHDVQELCRVMFDALEQKFRKTEQADLINRLYQGKMIDYVKCLKCNTEKSREDTFLDIPLPVRPFGGTCAYGSVEEALKAFVQPETLEGQNQYHCETCQDKCDAHKGLKFKHFPYLLTLHLKRFDFDYNTLHRIKLNDKVTFPEVLNLNNFILSDQPIIERPDEEAENESNALKQNLNMSIVDDTSTTDSGLDYDKDSMLHGVTNGSDNQDYDEGIGMSMSTNSGGTNQLPQNSCDQPEGPYVYELFSIMIHSGSASGGHYYAYIKDFKSGHWYCFNDQNVTMITQEDIQRSYGGGPSRLGGPAAGYYSAAYSSSTNAYMLMYRQIDPVRNVQAMEVEDFPEHIKELLQHFRENESDYAIGHYNGDKPRRRRNDKESLLHRVKLFTSIDSIPGFHNQPLNTPANSQQSERRDDTIMSTAYGELLEVRMPVYPEISMEQLTKEAVERVLKKANCGSGDIVIRPENCRLVFYDQTNDCIECSLEGEEQNTLLEVLANHDKSSSSCEMILEIKNPNEPLFKPYYQGGINVRIFIVDVVTQEVEGPIMIRGNTQQTILDFKKQLVNDLHIPISQPQNLHVVCDRYYNGSNLVDDKVMLRTECSFGQNRFFISTRLDPTDVINFVERSGSGGLIANHHDHVDSNVSNLKFISSKLKKIVDLFEYVITLNFTLPPLDKDTLDAMAIPSYDSNDNQVNLVSSTTATNLSLSSAKQQIRTNQQQDLSLGAVNHNDGNVNKTFYDSNEMIINQSPTPLLGEWENSEDSSLSDSDRTLIGEPPVEMEGIQQLDEDNLKQINDNLSTKYYYASEQQLNTPNEALQGDEATTQQNVQTTDLDEMDPSPMYFFRVTKFYLDPTFAHNNVNNKPSNNLRVLADKRMTVGALKHFLSAEIRVPIDYFKLFRIYPARQETECSRYEDNITTFRDEEYLSIKLGRTLRPGEYRGKIYLLQEKDSSEPFKVLCEWILSHEYTVAQFKAELFQRHPELEPPYDRWRVRKKNWKNPAKIYLDSMNFMDDISLYSNWEIFIQDLLPLHGNAQSSNCVENNAAPHSFEIKTNPDQLVLFVKRWRPSELKLDDFQEVVLDGLTIDELKEKLHHLSGIAVEDIEIAKAPNNFPCETSVLTIHNDQEWNPQANTLDSFPLHVYEDGSVFYYRDKNEELKELTAEEKREIMAKEGHRFGRQSSLTSTHSPRRERALKIYLDNSPKKKDLID